MFERELDCSSLLVLLGLKLLNGVKSQILKIRKSAFLLSAEIYKGSLKSILNFMVSFPSNFASHS